MNPNLNDHSTSSENEIWKRPDVPIRCSWKLGENKTSPHNCQKLNELIGSRKTSHQSIADVVGFTPLVLLRNIMRHYDIKCNLYAKCEFLSPFGSVKDRIALRMVLEAEKEGILKPGCTLIEPTSGNTGIGIAAIAAVRGYKCIIVIPQKMSNEKVSVLKALGARVIRTPTSAAFDSPDSNIRHAQRLQKNIPDSIILDQYRNPYNPIAHYDTTAEEIILQTDGNIHAIVVGAGTGGTITGISRKIKEKIPSCRVVGVDPVGSILAQPSGLNAHINEFYEVEGIGYDFIPTVLDRGHVDEWIKVGDNDALNHARELIKLEALLCGASSGSAIYAGIKIAKTMREGENCVVLLPDSVRNYMTKFLDDNWMMERGFIPSVIASNNKDRLFQTVSNLQFDMCTSLSPTLTVEDAIKSLDVQNTDSLPIVDQNNNLVGIFDTNVAMNVFEQNISPKSSITTCMDVLYKKAFSDTTTLESLFYMFRSTDIVYVVSKIKGEELSYIGKISKRSFLTQINKF